MAQIILRNQDINVYNVGNPHLISLFGSLTVSTYFIVIICAYFIKKPGKSSKYKSLLLVALALMLLYYFWFFYKGKDHRIKSVSIKTVGLGSMHNLLVFIIYQCFLAFFEANDVLKIGPKIYYNFNTITTSKKPKLSITVDEVSRLSFRNQIILLSKTFNIFIFDKNNILHKCGFIKLSYFFKSRIYTTILLAYAMSVFILQHFQIKNMDIIIISSNIILTVMLVLYIFTLNIQITLQSLKLFHFWFKMYNFIIFQICYVLLIGMNVSLYFVNINYFLCFFILISGYMGMNIDKCFKILMIIIIICIFTTQCINITYIEDISYDNISLKGIMMISLYNIILFISLQIYQMMISNKCHIIHIYPIIKWRDNYNSNTQLFLSNHVSSIN